MTYITFPTTLLLDLRAALRREGIPTMFDGGETAAIAFPYNDNLVARWLDTKSPKNATTLLSSFSIKTASLL